MARKATWQSHASPCRRPRGTEVTRVCALYIYILYSYKYKNPDYQNSLTHKTAPRYIRGISNHFLRVGLIHSYFEMQIDVAEYGALDQKRVDYRALIAWTTVHSSSSTHVTISKPSISLMKSNGHD